MEELILEVRTRGLFRYYPVKPGLTRIGRALDNDIILSDPTVEPEHMLINYHVESGVEIENLATTNPLKVGARQCLEKTQINLPTNLNIGRIHARLLTRDHEVAETRAITGGGDSHHLFNSLLWSIVLVIVSLAVGAIGFYLNSYTTVKPGQIVKYILREPLLTISLLVAGLAILERLLVNRWEVKPIIISVCLLYLAYQILTPLINEMTYWFSSSLPGVIFFLFWYLLLLPGSIASYLVKISHLSKTRSVVLALLIASPVSAPALMQGIVINLWLKDFRATAQYQKSLSPYNWHLSSTRSIDGFIAEASKLEPGEIQD